jgi:hypothetical protein
LDTNVISHAVLTSCALATLALPTKLYSTAQLSSTVVATLIQPNANRVPAGKLENGVLSLRLELREGGWYPEAETGPSLKVYAFAEEGKAPQIPGPLIRGR